MLSSYVKVFIDMFLVLYTSLKYIHMFLVLYILLFCTMNVLEFETYDKGFYENSISFQYLKPNHYIV